jgi:PST family polysaccharide transporter
LSTSSTGVEQALTFSANQSLSGVVASSAAWTAGARIGLQACALISTAVVARLIPPSAYGLLAMAQVVTNFIIIFRDLGIKSAVIQRRAIDERILSSVFWVNLAISLLCVVGCWLSAPAAAGFFREPQVAPVLRVLSLAFAITGVSTVHLALLSRSLQFRTIAIAEIVGAVAGLITAVGFALAGTGVWALVASWLANSAVSTAGLILGTSWRPKAIFSWSEVRGLARFSLNLSGFHAVNYFARNADTALVGRYFGNAALGYYQLAYTVMLLPVTGIAQQVVGRVLFPALATMQDDNARFRKAYVRTCAAIGFLTFPMMAGVAVLAEPFVYVLLGDKYRPVAPVLAILAPVGMIQSIATTIGQVYTAKGRTEIMLWWGIASSLLYVVSFIVGLPFGIRGIAMSYAIMVLLLLYPTFAIPFRLIDLRVRDLARALWPGVLCTLLMVIVVVALRMELKHMRIYRPITILVLCSSVGAAIYFGLAYALRVPIFLQLRELVRRKKRGEPGTAAA